MVFRFKNNLKSKIENRVFGKITTSEMDCANLYMLQTIQLKGFSDELKALRKNQSVGASSKIRQFSPFIEQSGLLRVGGRIEKSQLSYDHKHPILLPSNSPFTTLLFQQEHVRLFHAGPQLLLSNIRKKYWPLHGNDISRKTVHKCITCTRHNPKLLQQLMG